MALLEEPITHEVIGGMYAIHNGPPSPPNRPLGTPILTFYMTGPNLI